MEMGGGIPHWVSVLDHFLTYVSGLWDREMWCGVYVYMHVRVCV